MRQVAIRSINESQEISLIIEGSYDAPPFWAAVEVTAGPHDGDEAGQAEIRSLGALRL